MKKKAVEITSPENPYFNVTFRFNRNGKPFSIYNKVINLHPITELLTLNVTDAGMNSEILEQILNFAK